MGLPATKLTPQAQQDLIILIRSFPLFKSFPDDFVAHLAQAGVIVDLPADSKILTQGQMNEHLFFLITGQVGIYVDGGMVSQLQRTGSLLGEMSVISARPVGATIVAQSQVSLLKVDSKFFLEMQGAERDLCLSILYRIYATVLVEKLDTTNQKAKYFEELTVMLTNAQKELEETNADLERKVEQRTLRLEQQNAELMASKTKTEDLLNGKRMVFSKLVDLHEKHLIPLKTHLDEVRKGRPLEASIENARSALFDVHHLISPIVDQQAEEEAIQSKKVLFADANKKQQVIAKMALGGTGVELEIVSSAEEGREKIENGNYDLVVFDVANLELGNLARAKDPKVGTVLMTSDQIPEYLPALKQLSSIPHIVSRDEADRTFTVKNILTTVTKLLSKNLFGLEKYLSWGVDIQTKPVFSSQHRPELIDEVDAYFEKLGVRSANRDRVRIVLEEMLMNAIYDAPTDAQGKAIYNHLPRTVPVNLKPEQQGVVRYATDGMLIAVSVSDPFGSLKGDIILRYLESNYQDPNHEINTAQGKGGAGRGLHQIVENADLIVFNVNPGQRTEVIALFNVDMKEKATRNSSFHLFVRS